MPDFSQLAARVARARRNVWLETERIVEETAIAMLEHLAQNTPVDTTQAISNWQVGVGGEDWTWIPPHFPGRGGSTKPASVAQTIQLGSSIIRGQYLLGGDIHLTNRLRYIRGLNNGTISRQPGAFVQGAMLIARLHLRHVTVTL